MLKMLSEVLILATWPKWEQKSFQKHVEDAFSWEKPYIVFLIFSENKIFYGLILSMKLIAKFIIILFNQLHE